MMVRTGLPLLLCILLGWADWRIHRPAIIGSDGMTQVMQAWSGRIEDWFSPPMTAALRQVWLLQGTFNHVALLQAVLGCVGIFVLARSAIRFCFPMLLTPGRESAVAFGIVLLLMQPLSPLSHMLVFIQTDTWLLISLVWSVGGWLNLAIESGGWRGFWWCSAIIGSTAVVLARHNAVVLLPVFALLAVQCSIHRGRRTAIIAGIVTVALPLVAGNWIDRHYEVARRHPEDQILANDLVGVCVLDESARSDLPYTNVHLIEGKWREKHHFGFVNVMYLYSPASERPTDVNYVGVVVNGEQRYGSRHEELASDYRRAVFQYPFTLARVKLRAFQLHLVHDHPREQWHPLGVVDNPFGLKPDQSMAVPRRWLEVVDRAVTDSPTLRFLCTNHLPWFAVCLFGSGFAAGFARRGGRRQRIGFLVSLLPLLYYFTHLLAVAGAWYRYMYPAALLVQIGSLVVFIGVAVHAVRRWRAFIAKNCISLTPPVPRIRTTRVTPCSTSSGRRRSRIPCTSTCSPSECANRT